MTTILSGVVAATLLNVVTPQAAQADGPSTQLPDTPQTTGGPSTQAPRPPDQASTAALSGDQPAGTAPAGAGTPTSTPLAPSATWQVSTQVGDFTWSYPLRVPPGAGDLVPELALSYTSSTVDGRTSAANNQASWAGDGWDLHPGFVERTYGGCSEDDMGDVKPTVFDLCWRSDNATSSKNGVLIAESGSTSRWRGKSDDGSRIERLTDATGANGDDNGESWKITTPEGVQYFYGSRPESKSTWTVPVYGDDTGEPCHKSTFVASRCTQAWRWNLDKVVDPHGNMMIYTYDVETNKYGANLQDVAVPYTRGGTPRLIEYGLRADGSTAASGQVEFITADRCVPGSQCVSAKKDNWPDVPWESHCDGATCPGNYSPSFWSTKRLAKVVTRVRGANGLTDVDSWTLDHQFPNPNGPNPITKEKAALWLKSIVHTGHPGEALALPAVTFEGTAMPNRVAVTTGVGPLNRYRVTGIVSEAGGTIGVTYATPNCVEGSSMPANAESNELRCYPARWTPPGGNERVEYFHKYVVQEIVQSDRYDGTSQQRTVYDYLDGAAWHLDTSEFTKEAKRTYSEFRGFRRIRVRSGNPGDPAGPVSEQEQRFYRGMDGDRLPNNGKRDVSLPDSKGGSWLDSDWLAGTEYESTTLNGVNGPAVETTITKPSVQGPFATRGDLKSYLVRPGLVTSYTALADGAWRETQEETRYDDRGQAVEIDDYGDLATAADDQCTRNTYARNESAWIISLPYRTQTVGVRCAQTPSMPEDAVDDTLTGYDGQEIGVPPTAGSDTRTKEMKDWARTGEPVYVTTSTAVYDVHGRVTSSTDALGKVTTTAYTPALGGPATKTEVTNPLGHVTSTTLAPAWGQPTLVVDPNLRRTETFYDALGRRTAVWLPNRKRVSGDTASATFTYRISRDGPPVVTTARLNTRGSYTTTKEIYDPLMRLRQVQAPASGGGRLLTDTRYDSHGRVYFTSSPYFHDSAVDDTLWVASEVDKLAATMTEFDGAGRTVATALRGGGVEKWRTTQAHEGDRVHTTPPQGGTPFTTVTDARGRTVEIRQGSAPDVTKYTYTRSGELASIVDSMGNSWRYEYDLRGFLVRTDDPDKGVTRMEYDDAGHLTATTDALGEVIHHAYDELGRRTGTSHEGEPLATWKYDTASFGKGLLAGSTRHVGTAEYTTSIGSYNQLNKPLSVSVTVPENEQTLAQTYTTQLRYDYDGELASKTLPKIGSLPEEGIVTERDELGLAKVTRGGYEGQTIHYVTDSIYTRQREIARIQLGEGTERAWQTYNYDAHTRRLERTITDVEAPAPQQSNVAYTYDPAGDITSMVDAPLDQTADKQCFRYDQLRRLTDAWTPSGECTTAPEDAQLAGPAPYRHRYTYDKAGNRLSASTVTATSTYAYPAAGTRRPHAVTSVTAAGTTQAYGYDAAGNMTERPGQTLEWDVEGRVSKVSSAAGDTTFVYDADGNRLIRRTADTTTLYLDGQELTLNRNTGGLNPTRYYTHGGKTIAVRTASTILHWLLGDHQDTTQISVNAESMALTRQRQAPFGAPRGAPVDLPGERGFVGGTEDESTSLVHIGAREYDADLGRFISVDPVMGSEPQLLNAYAYSNNSPVTFSDPTGRYCDGCDYANYKYGDSSVWTPPTKRKSFCDSCEYYSNKYGTKSAWNQKYYGWKVRPTVFKQSKELDRKRRAAAEAKRKDDEAKRKAEEECGFWCGVGNRLKAVTSSPVFKWTGVALGVAGMFGCVVCGAISLGMSAVQTGVDCTTGGSTGECAMGAASVVLGVSAIGAGRLAGSMWASGADIINKGARVAQEGHRIVGAAVRGAGHVVQGAARIPMAQAFLANASSLAIDTLGAAGVYQDLQL